MRATRRGGSLVYAPENPPRARRDGRAARTARARVRGGVGAIGSSEVAERVLGDLDRLPEEWEAWEP